MHHRSLLLVALRWNRLVPLITGAVIGFCCWAGSLRAQSPTWDSNSLTRSPLIETAPALILRAASVTESQAVNVARRINGESRREARAFTRSGVRLPRYSTAVPARSGFRLEYQTMYTRPTKSFFGTKPQ